MSQISLEEAKAYLNVIHDHDDDKLQMLLDGAEDEAAQFMWRESISGPCAGCEPQGDDSIPPGVIAGVMLLLQASYDAAPSDIELLRAAAETKLMPYRCGLGV